ncbi:hypothetical protein [Priestia flexa]|uniref:hypothetical protein n=1 Tax=Priestia TaxID=2800373 RepID=UPI0035BE6B11
MIIGYMRPYEGDINCKNQELSLQKIPCDTIIKEEHGSAKKRVQLANLKEFRLGVHENRMKM